MQTVLVSAGGETHRTGAQARSDAIDHEIHMPHQHDEHLFVDVVVRRVGRAAGGQLRLVHLDGKAVMQISLSTARRLIHVAGAAGFYRQILELIRLRGNVAGLRLGARGGQGWKKES